MGMVEIGGRLRWLRAAVGRRLGGIDGSTLLDSTRGADTARTSREGVLAVLERRGGRARQRDIVDATEWSKSTVSRALCQLEASGEVARHKMGREKIVTLPDESGAVDADATAETGGLRRRSA